MSARREEAYLSNKVNKQRSFRTCGHNKLCPYKGWILIFSGSNIILNSRKVQFDADNVVVIAH